MLVWACPTRVKPSGLDWNAPDSAWISCAPSSSHTITLTISAFQQSCMNRLMRRFICTRSMKLVCRSTGRVTCPSASRRSRSFSGNTACLPPISGLRRWIRRSCAPLFAYHHMKHLRWLKIMNISTWSVKITA